MSEANAIQDVHEIPEGATVVHEPYGFVHLLEARATDLDVVNAARVSFAKMSEWEGHEPLDSPDFYERDEDVPTRGILKESDDKVLRFLMLNHHGTPFEHTYLKFLVRAPIFVFREWHRHRIGISINEESARYVDLRPDFYVPQGDRVRRQTDKPGRYKMEEIPEDEMRDFIDGTYRDAYVRAYAAYERLLGLGVAREVARTVLPVGIYSTMVWTCNARSLMAFLTLRNADTALREIRDYARAMEEILEHLMPRTHAHYVEGGRVAP